MADGDTLSAKHETPQGVFCWANNFNLLASAPIFDFPDVAKLLRWI